MSLYSFRKVLKADEITVVNSFEPRKGRRLQNRVKNKQAAAEKLSAQKEKKTDAVKGKGPVVPADFQETDHDVYQQGYVDGVAAGEKKERELSLIHI